MREAPGAAQSGTGFWRLHWGTSDEHAEQTERSSRKREPSLFNADTACIIASFKNNPCVAAFNLGLGLFLVPTDHQARPISKTCHLYWDNINNEVRGWLEDSDMTCQLVIILP